MIPTTSCPIPLLTLSDNQFNNTWFTVASMEIDRCPGGGLLRTAYLRSCYRVPDRVFQPHAAEFLQASCSGPGEIASPGRDSPVVPPSQRGGLAVCQRAGSTEKLTQVAKSDRKAHFFISISDILRKTKHYTNCLRYQVLRSHMTCIQMWTHHLGLI